MFAPDQEASVGGAARALPAPDPHHLLRRPPGPGLHGGAVQPGVRPQPPGGGRLGLLTGADADAGTTGRGVEAPVPGPASLSTSPRVETSFSDVHNSTVN